MLYIMKKIVWKFTNQRELSKSQFIDYFERKIFRTIRKYCLLPKNKIIKIKKTNSLNTAVLNHVLLKKFNTKFSNKPNLSSENLSEIAEEIFSNTLKGKFFPKNLKPEKIKAPLYFLSDEEIELYAKLGNIKGKRRIKNKKIQQLFEKFKNKNPDLEHNIANAFLQI